MTSFFKKGLSLLNIGVAKPEEEPAPSSHQGLDDAVLKEVNPEQSKSGESQGSEERSSLWKILSSKLGMDVTVGLTLPVWLFEPVTALQRMAEMVNSPQLLNDADGLENSLDRLAYVAVFAISSYDGTERFGKPFNPIIGETFEFIDSETNMKFFSEQVSHHPPVSVSHAFTNHFTFWQDSRVRTKLLGNSLDIIPLGKTHIKFTKSQDHFYYTATPTSRVNNLIIGSMWIDHFGELTIKNIKTNDTCQLTFQRCGWLGTGRYEVSGFVKDAEGNNCLSIQGKWNESISVTWLHEKGKHPKGTTVCLWKISEPKGGIGKHKLTKFASKLNELDTEYEKLLPPTDSRLRPDRRYLDSSDLATAAAAKARLEDKQRMDKKTRQDKNEDWKPRWFKENPEEDGTAMWVYCGDYWEQRERKAKLLNSSEPEAKAEANKLLGATFNEGLACDFKKYMEEYPC